MPFLRFSRTYHSLLRVKTIVTVLSRHGFGHLVESLNLRQYVPFLSRLFPYEAPPAVSGLETLGQRLRQVMEELGPTFVKLGQLLSGRPDLIPEPLVAEFRKLQDAVPPFDSGLAREIIERELGRPVESAYASFGAVPIASGSIGQAHTAELPDGTAVVVKVRRPGIEREVATDLDLLTNLAELAERYVEELRVIRPVMIVEEFARNLRKEMDFVSEATYTAKFHDQLAGLEGIRTPRVFWDHTTPHVLTLERLAGSNIGDYRRLEELGLDRARLAARLASAFMRQYFETGLFHADPHPGNLLVDESGTIGLIDFGMVGHLSPTLKGQLASVVLALLRNDLEMIVQIYTDMGAFSEAADTEEVRSDILELLDRYFGVPLHKVNALDVFTALTRVARKNKVVLPRDFVLLSKSLVTVATLCRELDPEFSLVKAARPHLWPIVREKLSPLRLLNQAMLTSWNVTSLLQRLPGDLKILLHQARRGELRVIQRYEGLEPLSRALERASGRVAVSLVASAFVLASAYLGQRLQAPFVTYFGFTAAGLLGLWLVFDILRGWRLR